MLACNLPSDRRATSERGEIAGSLRVGFAKVTRIANTETIRRSEQFLVIIPGYLEISCPARIPKGVSPVNRGGLDPRTGAEDLPAEGLPRLRKRWAHGW
jgi:hypothetical protein